MMSVFVDQDFTQGWSERITGDGQVSVNNGVLTCKGSGRGDAAFREYHLPVQPGQEFEIEILARKKLGEPRVSVDLVRAEGGFDLLDYIQVNSSEWSKHRLKVTIPYNTTHEFIRVSFGKWGSRDDKAEGEFRNPIIKTNTGLGTNLTLATGLLRAYNNVFTIHSEKFRAYGIDSVSYNASKKTVTVNLKHNIPDDMRPVIIVSGTNDSALIPLAGKFTGGSNSNFEIKWTNGTEFVDISAQTVYVYLHVFM